MIVDALLQFSGTVVGNTITGQSLAVGPSTVVSTNVIDLAGVGTGNVARDIGQGQGLDIVVEVTQAFVGGTSMQIQLVSADDAAISVNVTPIIIDPATLTASLTLGQQMMLHLDPAFPSVARRYLALQYIILGTFTAGAVVATVVKDLQLKGNNTLFASGFAIS